MADIQRIGGLTRRNRNRRILAACPVCHICGKDIDLAIPYRDPTTGRVNPMSGVVDHDQPLARGGNEKLSNLKPAHALCNGRKSDRDHAPIIRRSSSLQ